MNIRSIFPGSPPRKPSQQGDADSEKERSGGVGDPGSGRTHVFLNVYDLTTVNSYLYWAGLGIFHSGIEVHGMEYGFGAHDYPTSGVFEVEPKSCPGFIFRRSIWLGTTDMPYAEFRLFIEDIAGKYHGDTYHLIIKNCNHFTDDLSTQLTGKPIPGWVNRLARVGSFCNCILPESIQVTAVRHLPAHTAYSDDDSDSLAFSFESDEECDLLRPSIDLTHSKVHVTSP